MKESREQDDRTLGIEVQVSSSRTNQSFHYFRYVIITLGGLAMGLMLFLRLTITVAMISMVNHTDLYIQEHPNSTLDELKSYFHEGYIETGDFSWSNEIQQTIIAGYMVAYTIPQFFTTRLVMRYGLRVGIPTSIAICSLSDILTPILSYWGWQFALMLRLLNGIGGSAVLPSMVNAIENWLPARESAKGVALFQFMSNLLYATTPLIAGILTSYHWKWAFFVPGIIGLIFCVIWYIFVADKPELSRYLSLQELNLIKGNCENDEKSNGQTDKVKVSQRHDLPWYFMFKIKTFYSMTFLWCLYCSSSGGFLFLLPTYINRVLKAPVEEIGRLNFYVQLGTMFCMLWPHPFANLLQKHFRVGLSAARSIVLFICEYRKRGLHDVCQILEIPTNRTPNIHFITGVSVVGCIFIYLAFYHDNLVIMICINRFFNTTTDTIVMATVMSQFGHAGVSGLVYSMVNTFGNLTTVFYCWAVGRFLDYSGETLDCWSWIFYSLITMNVLYFLVYAGFCPSKPIKVTLPPTKQIDDVDKQEK